jgi:hypothetical protein
MCVLTDHQQINQALTRCKAALDIPADSDLNPDEFSVFLKYGLIQDLDNREIGYWRQTWQTDAGLALQQSLQDKLRNILSNSCIEKICSSNAILQHFRQSPAYQKRIVEIAMAAVLSEALAPEICIKPAAVSEPQRSVSLPGVWRHAIIFASAHFIHHEFYPLAVDALAHGAAKHGRQNINVLAAQIDWLGKDGGLTRIIHVDMALNRLIECDLAEPLTVDSVQFLSLGKQEQAIHKAYSQKFSCLQINPADVSGLADDKSATLAGWSSLGLETPKSRIVVAGDLHAAFAFMQGLTEVVIKPNQASEGELVEFFQVQNHDSAVLQTHLQQCWGQGRAIVQQRCDGVVYADPATGTQHTLVLRLNVSRDAENTFCLESGYAQVGKDLQHPASCGRGGRILAIHQVLPYLQIIRQNQPVQLCLKDWIFIRQQAELAASLFQELLLVGVDAVLDVDEQGKIQPVFLEANPRPAGLCHSRLLSADPFADAQIGVCMKLWDNMILPAA